MSLWELSKKTKAPLAPLATMAHLAYLAQLVPLAYKRLWQPNKEMAARSEQGKESTNANCEHKLVVIDLLE